MIFALRSLKEYDLIITFFLFWPSFSTFHIRNFFLRVSPVFAVYSRHHIVFEWISIKCLATNRYGVLRQSREIFLLNSIARKLGIMHRLDCVAGGRDDDHRVLAILLRNVSSCQVRKLLSQIVIVRKNRYSIILNWPIGTARFQELFEHLHVTLF